jgi:hypothetical protein
VAAVVVVDSIEVILADNHAVVVIVGVEIQVEVEAVEIVNY